MSINIVLEHITMSNLSVDERKEFMDKYQVEIERSNGEIYIIAWYPHNTKMHSEFSQMKFRYLASVQDKDLYYNVMMAKLKKYMFPTCVGLFESWSETGIPKEVSNWKHGQPHGKIQLFYNGGGESITCNYYYGELDGRCIVENRNSIILTDCQCMCDILNGLVLKRYYNGNKRYYVNYEYDLKHGDEFEFYQYGGVKSLSQYVSGELHGISATWDVDQKITSLKHYDHGKQYEPWYSKLGLDTTYANKYIRESSIPTSIIWDL